MSFHDTPRPSRERSMFDESLKKFNDLLNDATENNLAVRKDYILTSIVSVMVNGLVAVNSGDTMSVTYGLPKKEYSNQAQGAFTDLSRANNLQLIQPPFTLGELSVLDQFVQQSIPTDRA